jgi:hypothetical protein
MGKISVSFRVFGCFLCSVAICLGLVQTPFSPLPSAAAAETGLFFERIDPVAEADEDDNWGRMSHDPVIEDDGTWGWLWKSEKSSKLSRGHTAEMNVIGKDIRPFDHHFSLSDRILDGRKQQLQIFRLKQKSDSFSYGAEYRYVAKDLKNPKSYRKMTSTNYKLENDQEGVEVWAARDIGPIRFKPFFSRFWNNVDGASNRYQMLATEYGLNVQYKPHYLPIYFSLSYSQGQSESAMEPEHWESKGSRKNTYEGSLYYWGGEAFSLTASSSYSSSQDLYDVGNETESFWHEISATFSPITNLSISPTVSFGEYRYLWSGERTENPAASLSISYTLLFNAIDLSLWGEYSGRRGTAGYQDAITYSGSAEISWEAKYGSLPKTRFSLEFDYDAYIDKVYPESSYDDLSFSLTIKTSL